MPENRCVSCLIDVPRVKADIIQLETEITAGGENAENAKSLLKHRRRFLKAIEGNRLPKKRHLLMFVFLAQRFRNGAVFIEREGAPEIGPAEVIVIGDKTAEKSATTRATGLNLIRDPAKVQTQIAQILVDTYRPGDTFSISTAVDKLRHFVPEGSNPGTWLGTYMMREMRHTNGILEHVGPRRYRMRADASKILKNGQKPSKTAQSSDAVSSA